MRIEVICLVCVKLGVVTRESLGNYYTTAATAILAKKMN